MRGCSKGVVFLRGHRFGPRLNLTAWVSIAIVVTIALVGASILIAFIVNTSYEGETKRLSEEIGADYFMVSSDDLLPQTPGSRFAEPRDAIEIRKIKGVEDATVSTRECGFATYSVTKAEGSKVSESGFSIIGVEPTFFSVRHLVPSDGRLLDAADEGSYFAVVGAELAKEKGWKVGSVVKHLLLAKTYTIAGILKGTETSFWGFDQAGHDSMDLMVFVPLAAMPVASDLVNGLRPDETVRYYSKTLLWVSVKDGIAPTSLTEEVVARLGEITGQQTLGATTGKPTKVITEYVARQTTGSLWQISLIVAIIGLINISGLIMMHVFLNAKEIGIRRASGASADRIRIEYLFRYLRVSLLGTIIAVILSLGAAPFVARFLGATVDYSLPRIAQGIVLVLLIGPLASLAPAGQASKLSPVASIRDQMGWGIGRRRFDLRQLFVALAFGTAIGSVLFVSAFGMSSIEDVDRYLRASGSDTLVVSEPTLGSVTPVPRLTEQMFIKLNESQLSNILTTSLVASAKTVVSAEGSNLQRITAHAAAGDVLLNRNFQIQTGQWLTGEGQVVLGSRLAIRLFGNADPVGQTLLLGNNQEPFKVVGLLSPRPSKIADLNYNRDDGVFLTWQDRAVLGGVLEPRIYIQTSPGVDQAGIVTDVRNTFGSIDTAATGLTIENPIGALAETRQLQQMFSLCLLAMTTLAVLSTAAGISALTIVQAKEMSKTLAVLRACGATKRDVLVRILKEVLALVGWVSAAGLVLGQLVFLVFAKTRGLPVVQQYLPPLIGCGIAIAIALLSAYLPAKSVADQPPAALL